MTTRQKIRSNNKLIEELEKLCKEKNIPFAYISQWTCLIDIDKQHSIDLENTYILNKYIKIVEEL